LAVPVQTPVTAHRRAFTRSTTPVLPSQTQASAVPSDDPGTGRVTLEAGGHDSPAKESFRLVDDEPCVDGAVAGEPDVEDRGMGRRAPDVDDVSVQGLGPVTDVEPDAADEAPRRSGVRADGHTGPQNRAA
jgi:hypothetical protein